MEIKIFNHLPECALNIRLKVFGEEQGFVDEVDETDKIAMHFVAFIDGAAVATCRIFLRDKKYILGRFAVLKGCRKRGVGRALLLFTEEKVKELGYSSLSLHSQLRAVPFYEKCGYTSVGEVELEENYPHIWMQKVLS